MGKINIFGFVKKYQFFIAIGIIVFIFYTFNLNRSTRFIWDESRALVDMHRIWEQKLITFVGPISEDNLEMFPSLSYYMYLPGAILTKFDPLGPVYMAVLFGMFAWIIFTIVIVKKIGIGLKSFLFSLFVGILNPVLIASRWAWNPNPVIFWMMLFISSLFFETPIVLFLGGVSLGATLYHHYLAAFGVIPALIFLPVFYKNNKHIFRNIGFTISGFIFSIIPFALFEIKNHYFLNSASFLASNQKSFTTFSIIGYWERLWNSIVIFAAMFFPNNLFFTIFCIAMFTGLFLIFKRDNTIRYAFLSLVFSFLLFGFVRVTYSHYQYIQVGFALLFVFGYLMVTKSMFGKFAISLLLVSALFMGIRQINQFTWQGDIDAVRKISSIISLETESKVNIAAISSADPNTTGQKYRDMLLIGGKTLDAYNKYPEDKVLYVVSNSLDQAEIRTDPAWEMQPFRGAIITHTWKVSNYPTYLYRFEKI